MAFTNQAGTLLGPLTTTWEPPSSCALHFLPCPTCDDGFRGQQCASDGEDSGEGRPEDAVDCWPPAQVEDPTPPFVGWGFYSPGIACPTGYTTACTAVQGELPEWDIQFALRQGETAIGCCPE